MGLESQEAFARPCRAPALLLETPLRDLPPEAKVASVPHSLSSAGSQTVFSFETQTKLACEIEKSVHVRFSGGGGKPRSPGQILATPGLPPGTAYPHLGQPLRPHTWAYHPRPEGRGCDGCAPSAFVLLSFPLLRGWEDRERTKWGRKAGAPDKIAETLRLSLGPGPGTSTMP